MLTLPVRKKPVLVSMMYEDTFEDILNRANKRPLVMCFNPDCDVEFVPERIDHIYCTKECQQEARIEHGLRALDSTEFDPWIDPTPPQLWEGSITCACCNSKLPRQNPEWWTLKEVGYVCLRCANK